MDADLVLEGGGVKGIGLVGAYSALTKAGYTFHRIAGTSAGAIVGALIAADMEPERLETVMRTIDYGRFEDEGFIDHLGLVGKGLSVLFEKGIYEGRYLVDVAGRAPYDARSAHVRGPAHRRSRLLAAAREGVQARRDDVGRHEGRAGALALGLPGVRSRRRRPARCRCRARLDVDPVLLRAVAASPAATTRGSRCTRTWWMAACFRTSPSRCSTGTDGQAASLAHVRDQALGEACSRRCSSDSM